MYYLPFIIKFSIYKIKNLLSLKKKIGKLDDENNFFNVWYSIYIYLKFFKY